MMRSEEGPLDAASAAELVERVIRDLDRRNEEEGNLLLSDLLCAAWPTGSCQHQ
jgi:hypothetical protein